MEFVVALKQLKLDQTINNLTCGDLEIPVVMIQLRVTELKKSGLVYLMDLFGGRIQEGQCDLVCVKPLQMIRLTVVLSMSFSRTGSIVLVLWGFKNKFMLHCFREVKCQEFDIKYKVFYDIYIERITVALWYSRYHIKLRFRVVQRPNFCIYPIPKHIFYFQNTFVMKMNCGILESCVPIVTKRKSSKGARLLMSFKSRNHISF